MATTGGIDQLQRDIVGDNHTLTDMGPIIAQRGDIVSVGNRSSATGNRSVCIGYRAVDGGSDHTIIIGPSNTVELCSYTTILGSGWEVPPASNSAILIGSENVTEVCPYSVLIGTNIELNDSNGAHIIIAANNTADPSLVGSGAASVKMIASRGCSIGNDCSRAILIGEESTIGLGAATGSTDVVVIGDQNSAPDASSEVIIVGYSIDLLNANSPNTTIVGSGVTVGDAGANPNVFCSILGSDITIAHNNNRLAVLGCNIRNDIDSSSSVYIGDTMTIGAASPNAVAIGSALILSAASPRTTLIGFSNVLAGGSSNTVFIASSSSTTGPLVRSSLIGTQVVWDSGSDNTIMGSVITMPVQCDSSVAIGSNIIYAGGGPARTKEIAICASEDGSPTIVSSSSINLILIGSGNIYVGEYSPNCVLIGQELEIALGGEITFGSPEVVAVGNLIVIGDRSDGAVVVGSHAGVVEGALWSTVIGYNAHANGQAGIAIGALAVAPSRYCVIGNSNDDTYLTNLQVMGDDAAPFFEVYGNIPLARAGIDLGMKVWDGLLLNQISAEVAPPVGARLLYIL